MAALVGIFAGIGLATVDLALPIIVSGAGLLLLALTLTLVMPEERFVRPVREEGQRLHHSLMATFKEGVRAMRAHPRCC